MNWRARSTVAPFFDVLQDLRIAGFIAHNQKAAACFLHRLQRLVVGGNARRAGPRHVQRLQLGAEFNRARLLNVEGVVVKKEFLDPGPVFLGLGHFAGHVVSGAFAPGVTAGGLRPQAEGALRRASARGIQRDIGVEQKGHGVTPRIEIAIIDISDVGQSVQVLNLRPVRIMGDYAILPIRNSEDFVERLALREFDHRVIKLSAADEIDGRAILQGAFRQHGDMRSHERNLDLGVGVPDGLCQPDVPGKTRRAGVKDQKLIVLGNL